MVEGPSQLIEGPADEWNRIFRNESKMQDGKDQRRERNELHKLLRILAKQKTHSKSSSSSDQQTNTSSDESSEILSDGKSDQENDPAKG